MFWAARKSTVSRTALTIALFRSSSNPVMTQWVGVSIRGQSSFMSLRTMSCMTISRYEHSSAVRFTSPLPWRQCESPVHTRPPLRKIGMKMVVPACTSLMSMFEPFFHGRSVETGAIGSLEPPLRGEGSFGSMPTAAGVRLPEGDDLVHGGAGLDLVVRVHHGLDRDGIAGIDHELGRLLRVEPAPLGSLERGGQHVDRAAGHGHLSISLAFVGRL